MTIELVEELRERASFAREEKTGTALGDALAFEAAADRIDADAADAATMRGFVNTHHMTPSMVVSLMVHWQKRALAAEADATRYRYLRDHCSSHYPMTHEQPAEWSIGWEFQQNRPDQAYGSFDSWIDLDIAARAERQALIDDEIAEAGRANYGF